MVKRLALLALLALASRASADPEADRAVLGFRFAAGSVPIDNQETGTLSLGLTAEHPVARRWRLLGEYEWIWLKRTATDAMPELHGDGQRAHVGARWRFGDKRWGKEGVYVDLDFGAGFMLANDNMTGLHALPHGFVGTHLGYEELTHRSSSPSKLFNAEMNVRVLALVEGAGVMVGVGMAWQ